MSNFQYPTVDADYIINQMLKCDKIIPESITTIGHSTSFVLKGIKPMHKRYVTITHKNGQVNYMQASALASVYGFLGSFVDWLTINRAYKEGGYIVQEGIENEDREAAE